MSDWARITCGACEVAVDPALGNIRRFLVDGREVFHTAHWVGTNRAPLAGAPVDQHLSGDFFAAPFGASDLIDAPNHGWSANAPWTGLARAQGTDDAQMQFVLGRDVMGARLTKTLALRGGHRVLYQTHEISGGQGDLTFAHHPMFRMAAGGHLAFSPKRAALTTAPALEPEHVLAYPARSTDLRAFPAQGGGTFDLTQYPSTTGHEDFVTLIEAQGAAIGWTALTRAAEGDIIVVLKDARVAPVTMLWLSNGGRGYAPWDGRHTGVLGIEDGCAAGAQGHRAATGDNAIAREGVATALPLGPDVIHTVRHAIAVCDPPHGFGRVAHVRVEGATLQIADTDGAVIDMAFDPAFFAA
ncbi:hypothetical protein [Celeribacter marinus]|uniref:hypothetical protein n=1 Tax=Celeribacter marinus TaxID=1397108 RepID=UPI00316E6D01